MHLVALGDLNLDVLVEVPTDRHADRRPSVAGLPSGGGELRAQIQVVPGGAATTFARVAAAEGAAVTLIACVGDDPAGLILREALRRDGVRLLSCASLGRTGVVVCARSAQKVDGTHTMICDRGANDDLAEEVAERLEVDRIAHLHVSGYAFLSPAQRRAARAVIQVCTQHRPRIPISVDPPPAELIDAYGRERFLADLDPVSMLFPNEEEALLLTASTDVRTAVSKLAARFRVGAVTLGDRGAVVWNEGRRIPIDVTPLQGIHATGAGDAFAAGFVTSFHNGASADVAGRRGGECARRWIGRRDRTNSKEIS